MQVRKSCENIFISNSDTIVTNNNLRNCLDKYKEMELQMKIGLMGCQLLNDDDSLQLSSFNYFPGFTNEIRVIQFIYVFR